MKPDCLLVEGCDFAGFPPGGQLVSAKHMMMAFGSRLALVGICTDERTPIGRWIKRDFGTRRFLFYGIGRRTPSAERPWVPARISQAGQLLRHRAGILSLGVRAAFLQAPEDLIVVSRWKLDSLCYRFPGVANPLASPRYAWGRVLARSFDRAVMSALEKVDVIMASASEEAIQDLVRRSQGRLTRERVHKMTTHYDSTVFFPADQKSARVRLGVDACFGKILVCSGRLNRVKGWDLVLSAFRLVLQELSGTLLVFVGDGEDRHALERAAAQQGLSGNVRVTGFLPPEHVAAWLNAADLVLVASHVEGWSVAMLEALGCGKPIVSTDVSGAREMIEDGVNGFVVPSRSPKEYRVAILRALALPRGGEESVARASRYDIRLLARSIGAVWKVLA
jgi:glycosyltransferase involved in cell wall biosynthesis